MGKVLRALGLMSGTSMDGIDVALIETDGEDMVKRGPAMTFAYGPEMRNMLSQSMTDARMIGERRERPGALPHAERELTEHHGAVVSHFLRKQGVAREDIDVIGFHGQTVLHNPATRLTVQLGLGEMLAELTRIPVVFDLRAADVAAGGQGAPLVPVYHRALAARIPQRPLAVVNIGGVANITWIGVDGRLIAFDTGPGSALIDDWMSLKTAEAMDKDGALAAQGTVQDMVVSAYLSHPFFHGLAPKSLDRNAFKLDLVEGLTAANGAATLAAVTARAVVQSIALLPERPELWVICGGGRRNKTMMSMIAGLVENAVVPAEAVGLDGDSLEAEAWAYLAVRSLKGLPVTFPGTTGVPEALTGGVLARLKSRPDPLDP
jgi:anhydro-N-acetylmuramic acid kinase